MGVEKLTSRAVIGEFYKALNAYDGMAWIPAVSNYFTSDQASEEYAWLGQSPLMREWVGQRQANGLSEQSMTIKNKHFEATLEVLVRDMRRDKSGQVFARIQDLARRANTHWASLLSTLMIAGESTTCYDGQYFFDTDHSEGASGSQSNDLAITLSALPVATHGAAATPAVAEMQLIIARAVQAIIGFKDDKGEPMNEDASRFMVMAPVSLMGPVSQALQTPAQVAETQTVLSAMKGAFGIDYAINPRLTWTTKIAVFRTDSFLKSFIRQEESGISLKAKAEGSEFEFDNDAHQYGLDAWRNVGFGYWQNSCLVTMS